MLYPCSPFYADIKSDIRFDNRSDFGIAFMLNYTINHIFGNKIYGMINMGAIPKFDTKSVIKSDIKFDISTKPTTWIGHYTISKTFTEVNFLWWTGLGVDTFDFIKNFNTKWTRPEIVLKLYFKTR